MRLSGTTKRVSALFTFFAVALMLGVTAAAPPAAAQGSIPTTPDAIKENYDTLKQAVDRDEEALKDAIKDGNASKANGIRNRLQFYRKRLGQLDKSATGRAKLASDSQIVLKMTELSERITKILDDPKNKVAQPTQKSTTARAKTKTTVPVQQVPSRPDGTH